MKKYKFFYILLISILTTIGLISCSDDDEKQDPELIVSTESINFTKDASVKTFHIKANHAWTITSSDPSWCTVTPSTGEGTGTIKLELSTTANTSNDIRSATLTIVSGSITKQITVTQGLTSLLVVTQNEFNVDAEGGQISVEFQSTGDHSIEINSTWIAASETKTVSELAGAFSIATNNALMPRTGTITFSIGDISETVTIVQGGAALSIASSTEGMASNASELATKMKIGWNLGNSLESASSSTSASETLWGNPTTTKAMIDAVKAAGFRTVRIPCAWSGYIVDNDTYKISDTWLARVKEVVDYCVENEMYAIINIHWDGGWLEENPTYDKQNEVNKKQKALWEQIAVYFRDYDEHLLFAGTNEVHVGYDTPSAENISVQESFNQVFVDAVRSTGGRNTWRNIIVQSYNTNIDYAADYMSMPIDPTVNRIMAEVHYYDPWDFCGATDSDNIYLWGKDYSGVNVSSWGQEASVNTQFGKMKTKFVDNGVPVILGEFGAVLRSSLPDAPRLQHIAARNYYLNYITKTALNSGLVPIYWDNGVTGNHGFGLFNRSTQTVVHADALSAIISAGK